MTDGGGQYIPVPVPVQQEERLQKYGKTVHFARSSVGVYNLNS